MGDFLHMATSCYPGTKTKAIWKPLLKAPTCIYIYIYILFFLTWHLENSVLIVRESGVLVTNHFKRRPIGPSPCVTNLQYRTQLDHPNADVCMATFVWARLFSV